MSTNQVTQTDPGARARVIKLGLDVHASLIVVVRQVDEQASQPPQRFSDEGFIGFVHRELVQADAVHMPAKKPRLKDGRGLPLIRCSEC